MLLIYTKQCNILKGKIDPIHFDASNQEIQKYIQEQRHYAFGKCYTFDPGKDILQNGIEYINFSL